MKIIEECNCGSRIEIEGEALEVFRIYDTFIAAHRHRED